MTYKSIIVSYEGDGYSLRHRVELACKYAGITTLSLEISKASSSIGNIIIDITGSDSPKEEKLYQVLDEFEVKVTDKKYNVIDKSRISFGARDFDSFNKIRQFMEEDTPSFFEDVGIQVRPTEIDDELKYVNYIIETRCSETKENVCKKIDEFLDSLPLDQRPLGSENFDLNLIKC